MKRATLSILPAATLGQAEPADLTDLLLERERQHPQAQPTPGDPALPETPPKRRRGPSAAKRAARQAPAGSAAPSAQPTHSIHAALALADEAVQRLQDAGRSEPARFELALRYRLDALAHHVQQVREFVNGFTAR